MRYHLVAFNEYFEEEIYSASSLENIDRYTMNYSSCYDLRGYLSKDGYDLPSDTNFKIVSYYKKDGKEIKKERPIVVSDDYKIVDYLSDNDFNKYRCLLKISLINMLYNDEFLTVFKNTAVYDALSKINKYLSTSNNKKNTINLVSDSIDIYLRDYSSYRDLFFDMKKCSNINKYNKRAK